MSHPPNKIETQKQTKPNDIPLSDNSDHLGIPLKRHTLALLLENVAKIMEACAFELRKDQMLDSNISSQLLCTQNLLNSLQDIKPKVLASDTRTIQLCTEFTQTDNNYSISSHPMVNEGFSNKNPMAKKATGNPSETLSNPESDFNPEECGQSNQSKFKNCYGLVMGRTIKSIKEYFRLFRPITSKAIQENSRYYYIHKIISDLSDYQTDRFEGYLHEYHMRSESEKKNRGKTTTFKFLEQDVFNGIILIKIIQTFLQRENTDFQNYISIKTKPKKQMSRVLSDEKNLVQLRDSFSEMLFYLEQKKELNTKDEAF